MKEKYVELKDNIVSLDDESSKKELSSWIKTMEEEN